MSEVLFYHLERYSLEDVLPGLLERTLARGWRALVRAESADRAQALDTLLWTWNEESFLPHSQLGDGDTSAQPVLITVEGGNPNRAEVLFLVGGAIPDNWNDDSFSRVVVLFDGRDGAALAAARGAWQRVKELGHEATYWRQSAPGKWEKQA
ncbi:MAG TPA: DNA polymerase III subunit chi [Rhizomicrobium sp.]|jgi:DNA polymerase-3 subunit chi|nr:DNA polymerase III subunit chi [Rhizomicrobium sp.]